jgi:hypothetical protein
MIATYCSCSTAKSLHANFAFVGGWCLDFVPLRR